MKEILQKSKTFALLLIILPLLGNAQVRLNKGQVTPFECVAYDSTSYAKLRLVLSQCDSIAVSYDSCASWAGFAHEHVATASDTLAKVREDLPKAKRHWSHMVTDRRFMYGALAGIIATLLLTR